MRLIGTFDTEKEAYAFYAFLLKEGIQNIYESYSDLEFKKNRYRVWIQDEDDFPIAQDWLQYYQKHPEDARFQHVDATLKPTSSYIEVAKQEDVKWRTIPVRIQPSRKRFGLTHLVLLLCVGLFLWNDLQEAVIMKERGPLAVHFVFTPLYKHLFFDYPSAFVCVQKVLDAYPITDIKELKEIPSQTQAALQQAEALPSWKGLYHFFKTRQKAPFFEKVRQGEIWRLFTPCLLHRDFLHILFNMAWLWLLGKQIEDRIRPWKAVLLMLIVGSVSNIAQYIASGPYFLGFSGVVIGMAGFIWMRQRLAPWEGYPLNRGTQLFLLLFILSMVLLEFVTFALQTLSVLEITPVIANTAHVVGGLCGILLGRFSFFARGKQ